MSNELQNVSWPGWTPVRVLGHGSFGAVYEIQRTVSGHTVSAALKKISIPRDQQEIDDLRSDNYDNKSITRYFAESLERIEYEYAIMAELKGQPNIVSCDDIRSIQHDNGFGWDIYIKMELLTPLKAFLPQQIPEQTVIALGLDICKALIYCSKLQIVHRDIKPENIFVAPDGTFKLGDFGIAKTMEGTGAGTKTGTGDYMAPEVYYQQPYNTQVDLYSLGMVLYWMLNCRTMPFLPIRDEKPTAAEKSAARNRRFAGDPLPAPIYGSPELQRIVLKACAYDPVARYSNAQALWNDLNKLSENPAMLNDLDEGTVYDPSTKSMNSLKDWKYDDGQDTFRDKSAVSCTCGATPKPGAKFCHQCGKPIASISKESSAPPVKKIVCPRCGAKQDAGGDRCHYCSASFLSISSAPIPKAERTAICPRCGARQVPAPNCKYCGTAMG